MEKQQELEWAEAQKINISEDLEAAAKQHIRFLAEIERNGRLYDGPALDRAVYRYKFCWLPLLAKHDAKADPLVVPLDCEWIWHCHRLNPVCYKDVCKETYGRILDSKNVVSSVSGFCSQQTGEIWKEMYPGEPYELDVNVPVTEISSKTTDYDLVSAVKRQSSFFYQVSRPYMIDDLFLKEAVSRYKSFLHLIKKNYKASTGRFCVPTYDIDLIWHAHQLHPASYCRDLMAIMGKVLKHDDTDSDRTKGRKLDVGFSVTTKLWEETFGSRYWKAGAMYRGNNAQCCVVTNLSQLKNDPKKMLTEVMLEIVEVRNLAVGRKEKLLVVFYKKQPDMFFNSKRMLSISPETAEKDIAVIQCEPTGELVFELLSYTSGASAEIKPTGLLGTASISLQDLTKSPIQRLAVEKWLKILPGCGDSHDPQISLWVALSFTPPVPVSKVIHTCSETNGGWCCGFGTAGKEAMKSGGCGGCGGGCGGGSCNGGRCGSCGGGCGGEAELSNLGSCVDGISASE